MIEEFNFYIYDFFKVSKLFRHGNRITFLRDLEERLCDVLELKEKSICKFQLCSNDPI